MREKKVFVTGGTGFFGKWLLESFAWANDQLKLNAQMHVLSRNPDCFKKRYPHFANASCIKLHQGDVRDFVNEALMKAGEDWEKGKKRKIPLAQLIGKVASHLGLKEASIISSSRKREISEARGIICYLAVNDMGYSVSEVAHALEVKRVSAGQCVTRGEKNS